MAAQGKMKAFPALLITLILGYRMIVLFCWLVCSYFPQVLPWWADTLTALTVDYSSREAEFFLAELHSITVSPVLKLLRVSQWKWLNFCISKPHIQVTTALQGITFQSKLENPFLLIRNPNSRAVEGGRQVRSLEKESLTKQNGKVRQTQL